MPHRSAVVRVDEASLSEGTDPTRESASGGKTSGKESRLSIRASEGEKAILESAARARRMTMSQFVLSTSLDAAHAVLNDPAEFRLSPDQWKTFCDRLDEPPRVIPELQRLFNESEPHDS